MKPFIQSGQTEWSRICVGIGFIGGNGFGLVFSFLWWFVAIGLKHG